MSRTKKCRRSTLADETDGQQLVGGSKGNRIHLARVWQSHDEGVHVVEARADPLLFPHLSDGQERVAKRWNATDVFDGDGDNLA